MEVSHKCTTSNGTCSYLTSNIFRCPIFFREMRRIYKRGNRDEISLFYFLRYPKVRYMVIKFLLRDSDLSESGDDNRGLSRRCLRTVIGPRACPLAQRSQIHRSWLGSRRYCNALIPRIFMGPVISYLIILVTYHSCTRVFSGGRRLGHHR